MKTISFLIIVFCLSTLTPALAEEKWTIEKIYSYYETHYSPKEALHFAQEAALYVSGLCEGKKACDQVVADFFSSPSKWGTLDVKHLFITVSDIKTQTVIAHPNPKLHKIVNLIGLGHRTKDHNGKLWAMFAADGVKLQPKGFFSSKLSTYIWSATNIKEPLFMLNLYVLIPGTTMVIATNLPYRAKSTEGLDKVADKLNASVEEWSIIKGKVEYPK